MEALDQQAKERKRREDEEKLRLESYGYSLQSLLVVCACHTHCMCASLPASMMIRNDKVVQLLQERQEKDKALLVKVSIISTSK